MNNKLLRRFAWGVSAHPVHRILGVARIIELRYTKPHHIR